MFHRNPLSCLTGPISWQFAQNSKVYREFDLFYGFFLERFLLTTEYICTMIYIYMCLPGC